MKLKCKLINTMLGMFVLLPACAFADSSQEMNNVSCYHDNIDGAQYCYGQKKASDSDDIVKLASIVGSVYFYIFNLEDNANKGYQTSLSSKNDDRFKFSVTPTSSELDGIKLQMSYSF